MSREMVHIIVYVLDALALALGHKATSHAHNVQSMSNHFMPALS